MKIGKEEINSEDGLNKITKGWAAISFGDINAHRPNHIDPSEYPDEQFELWSVPSFPNNEPEIIKGSEIGSTKILVRKDDVLVCKINPRINRVWVVRKGDAHIRKIASSEWIVVRSANNPQYLAHYFTSEGFRKELCSELSGVGGSLTRAQPKRVNKYKILLPPLPEQERIAARLDLLLGKLKLARKRLDGMPELIKRFRKSVLAEAVSGRLTEEWRGALSAEAAWVHSTLGSITDIQGGLQKTPSRRPAKYCFPYLRVANVMRNKLDLGHLEYFELENENELRKYRLEYGDLLVVEGNGSRAEIGRAAIWRSEIENCIHQNHIIRCRPHSDICLAGFIQVFLNSETGKAEMLDIATTSAGLYTLSTGKLKAISIPLPSILEQSEIVRRVDELFAYADALEARVAEARKLADRLEPAILAKAFRGELSEQIPEEAIEWERKLAEFEAEAGKLALGRENGVKASAQKAKAANASFSEGPSEGGRPPKPR